MHFYSKAMRRSLHILCIFTVTTCLFFQHWSEAAEAEVKLRPVAADKPERPLISQPTDFRYSPFGGLVATNWICGITLNGEGIFIAEDTQNLLPDTPVGDLLLETEPDGLLGELDEELAAEAENAAAADGLTREADAVDPMYQDKFYEHIGNHRRIGPRYIRHSQQNVTIDQDSVLQPAEIRLGDAQPSPHVRRTDGRIEVDCYPVRLSAVREGGASQRVPFELELSWNGNDLLKDIRYEHSPALPAGPPDHVLDKDGKPRLFYDLTLYLLPTIAGQSRADTPYVLNGVPFHIGKDGIELQQESANLRKTGPFSIELVRPQETDGSDTLLIPVQLTSSLNAELEQGGEAGDLVWIPASQPALNVRHQLKGRTERVEFKLPQPPSSFPNLTGLCEPGRDADQSTLYIIGFPVSADSGSGELRLHLTAWSAAGQQSTPDSMDVELRAFPAGSASGDSEVTVVAVQDVQGVYRADVKDIVPGLYSVRFPQLIGPDAKYEVLVGIAGPQTRGAVSLLTYHNRCDYRQGEVVEVAAVLRAVEPVAATAVEVTLTGANTPSVALGTLTVSGAAGATDTRFFTIPTGHLHPDRYVLSLRSKDDVLLGHRLVFEVHPKELYTTWEGFSTTICETGPFRTPQGICSYHLMQHSPVDSLRDAKEKRLYTAQASLPASAQPVCSTDPLFPVPEATQTYDEREQALAAAMRFGVQYMPHGAWGLDGQTANWNPMHSYDESLDWMRRMYALRAQIYREFDSFGGFFMNWYPSLGPHYEQHPPRAGFSEFQLASLRQAVQQAQGDLPQGWAWSKEKGIHLKRENGETVKLDDMFKAGLEHPLFNSPQMRELVEWSLRGQRRRTEAFSKAYGAWTEVTRQLGDWNYLSFVPVGWFRSPNYYPPLYYEGLPRTGIHAYTDWQADPFMELFGIDYYGANSGSPPWVQAMSGGRAMKMRQTFLSAARGAWGVGLDAGTYVPEGREGENVRLINRLMHRYGPYFMELQPDSKVAILRSFHQEAADTGAFRGSSGRNGMVWFAGLQGEQWALYYNLLRYGYPADFITEEEVADGALDRYQAVFLHRQRLLLPDEMMQQFDEYVDNGGRVFKDPLSAPEYPGEVVEIGPDPSIKTNVGSSQHIIGARYLWLLHNYLQCKERVEKVLATLPEPPVRSDHYNIVHASLKGQDTRALFVINDTMVPPEVHTAEKWFIQGSFIMTRKGTLFFDKPCFVYDVTAGGRETQVKDTADDGTGSVAYPIEFLRSEGHVLVVTERPIRDMNFTADLIVRQDGDVLRIAAHVLDDAGKPFQDPLPFELTLQDPQGRTVKTVCRALGPEHIAEIAIGRTGPAGEWKLIAQELVSGRTADATFVLGEPGERLLKNKGRVLARRPDEIARFLRKKKKLTIVLDEGQSGKYRQVADELAAVLRTAGIQCQIHQIDPLSVYDLPLRWRRNAHDQALWQEVTSGRTIAVRRGLSTLSSQDWAYYDHPRSGYTKLGPQFALFRDAILLGSPRDNRLIADLHGSVGQLASAHFPGSGGALFQVTWDGFAPRHDVLSIQVNGGDSLDAAVAYVKDAMSGSEKGPLVERAAATFTGGDAAQQPLPNVQKYGFGTPIGSLQRLGDGDLLVSLGGVALSGPAYYRLDASGQVAEQYPDILGGLSPLGGGRYLHRWRDRAIFRDANLNPIWQLRGDEVSNLVVHQETGNVFKGGENRVIRLDPEGKTLWIRDFSEDLRIEKDFLNPWLATVRAVSEDGRRLLVSGFRERMYGSTVSGYADPALLLLNADTGETLWRRPGIMIRKTACSFLDNRIIACNSGEADDSGLPSLMLLDEAGKTVSETPLATKIVRTKPFGDGNLVLAEKAGGQGVTLLDLTSGHEVEVPVDGTIKGAWLAGKSLVVATWEKHLFRFHGDVSTATTILMPAPVSAVLERPDGQGLVVGTESGQVMWLDGDGNVEQEVDLNPYNIAEGEDQWAARWFAEDVKDVTERRIQTWVGQQKSTLQKVGKYADVSQNLLSNGDFLQGTQSWTVEGVVEPVEDGLDGGGCVLSGAMTQRFDCEPGKTYVLSLFQKTSSSTEDELGLTVSVQFEGNKETFQAVLPVSAGWHERTVSFQPPTGTTSAKIMLAVSGRSKDKNEQQKAAILLDRVVLATVGFRSQNALLQKLEKEPGKSLDMLGDDMTAGLDEVLQRDPPDIEQVIPWISHLAKATGQSEEPPRIVIPWSNMVDGVLRDQETSWTGKSLPQGIFSDHAELVVTFKNPRELSLVAIYHDATSPARYTTRFAVFAKTADGLKLLGSRTDNQSPYTLFAFEPVNVQSLIYYWAGSEDGHVRITEIEAYSGTEDLGGF